MADTIRFGNYLHSDSSLVFIIALLWSILIGDFLKNYKNLNKEIELSGRLYYIRKHLSALI